MEFNENKWIEVKEKLPPPNTKVLAIEKSVRGMAYSLVARGYFQDVIYACRMEGKNFVIESHGPIFNPSHWMPLPNPPLEEKSENPPGK